MEGDLQVDVKRPRLDYDSSNRHMPHNPAALPAIQQYNPHSLPPPPGHALGPPNQPPSYRDYQTDPRNGPYPPPPIAVGHPGSVEHRPSYGPPVGHHSSRSFSSSENGTPRPGQTPAHPSAEHGKGGPSPTAQEHHHSMEPGVHGGVYPIDPQMNPAMSHNGLPFHPSSAEQYPPQPAHHSYPSTPVVPYASNSQAFNQAIAAQGYSMTRRKQVRAQQACNNCRARKQKCDESRPCTYCKQEGMQCEYKEVPPPKTDRTMLEMIKKIDDVAQSSGANSQHNMELQRQNQELKSEISDIKSMLFQLLQNSAGSSNLHSAKLESPVQTNFKTDSQADLSVVEAKMDEAHATGAHHLSKSWPVIKDFYNLSRVFEGEEIDPNWVQKEEVRQQYDLRLDSWLYPRGEFGSGDPTGMNSPPQSLQDSASTNSPPDNNRGSQHPGIPNLPDIGGWNPDGSVKFDFPTTSRLFNSYMKNMWVIHPFIDASWLKRQVQRFTQTYGSNGRSGGSWHPTSSSSESYSALTLKRKRQSGYPDNHSSPSSPGLNHGTAAPRRTTPDIEPIVENAIVLLVLALGNILEHDAFLLQDDSTQGPNVHGGFAGQPYQDHFVKPSPPPHHSTLQQTTSAPSPMNGDFGRHQTDSRNMFNDYHNQRDRKKSVWPAERIPGIAYLSLATGILGKTSAPEDIPHMQAFLLKGLFYGQIGRVLESWQSIHQACSAIVGRFKFSQRASLELEKHTNEHLPQREQHSDENEIFIRLYWSALQLDSDIRAELDELSTEILSSWQSYIPLPSRLIGARPFDGSLWLDLLDGDKFDVTKVPSHFGAQLAVRRLLNRVHVSLYVPKSDAMIGNKIQHPGQVSWADADAWTHLQSLTDWRNYMPSLLQWDDDAGPSNDINQARLRGKYYGSAYVILRPYLQYAVYTMAERPLDHRHLVTDMPNSTYDIESDQAPPSLPALPNGPVNNAEVNDKILWACRRCIHSAMKSTVAFDGLSPHGAHSHRPRVTNIHGTATAQFSNMLVLAATYHSWLKHYINPERFLFLLNRTINLLYKLSPLSKVFSINQRVLETVRHVCFGDQSQIGPRRTEMRTPQAAGFAVPATAKMTRLNSIPASTGVDSVHSSFSNDL